MNGMLPDDEGTPLDWDKHEAEIVDLFVTQNKPLNQVMEHMRGTYGFIATARQYKHRFSGHKNVTDEEWLTIYAEHRRRAALGMKTIVYLNDCPLRPERVKRGINRAQKSGGSSSRVKKQPSKASKGGQDVGRTRISFRTPPPETAGGRVLAPVPVNGLNLRTPEVGPNPHGHTESAAPPLENDVLAEPMMLSDRPAGMPDLQPSSRSIDGDVVMDFRADIDAEFQWTDHTMGGLTIDPRAITQFPGEWLPAAGGGGLTPTFIGSAGSSPAAVQNGFGLLWDLPYFQLLRIIERPDYPLTQRRSSLNDLHGLASTPASASAGFFTVARSAFWKASDSVADILSTVSVAAVASEFGQLIPERYDEDLSEMLKRVLDPFQPASSTLPWLFSVVAYLGSNNGLGHDQIDNFLRWTIDQGHAESLKLFMETRTPTIHAFANVLLESAIRIKDVQMLSILFEYGFRLDRKLYVIAGIVGDIGLIKRILLDADPASLVGINGGLLCQFIRKGHFDLAQCLLDKGVSPDVAWPLCSLTALHLAVMRNDIKAIEFLLNAGADIDLLHEYGGQLRTTPLGHAVYNNEAELITFLLKRGAKVSCTANGMPLLEWAALHRRNACKLLKQSLQPGTIGVLIGDLVDAAKDGPYKLAAYITRQQPKGVKTHQLERALEVSIRYNFVNAVITLLQHGVSPNGPTLTTPPLLSALVKGLGQKNSELVDLLVEYNAVLKHPKILCQLAAAGPIDLLAAALASGIEVEHGMEALVRAAEKSNVVSAALLIQSGVHIDTPGICSRLNPLQTSASKVDGDMVLFLIGRGANVNAPAYPNGGRTALQAALESLNCENVSRILLHHGADASAPPALLNGVTALEAFCHIANYGDEELLYHELLKAGATVNRPSHKPSWAIHGAIQNEWYEILDHMLQHNTIITYLWDKESWVGVNKYVYKPCTPTQLAASDGNLKALTMLLDHGADINEAPGHRFGRTALQAAAELQPEPSKTAIIHFLLERGAQVNADPALECGVTALQAVAITGDLMLAKLLIERGAEVNAWPSLKEGRTAIEGAAEHGRLDMTQLLLNAGAIGDVTRRTGFESAVKLAKKHGHFAVANLLEEQRQPPQYHQPGF